MRRLLTLLAALAPPAAVMALPASTLSLPVALVALPACDQIASAMGPAAGTPTATASATATATACKGFRDVAGRCLDLDCLDEPPCDSTADIPCQNGIGEPACFNGQCAYLERTQGCGSGDDCPCGICGADGRCYHDRDGGCGRCSAGGKDDPKNSQECKQCLSSCAGTGPTCCAGEGCQCANLCGGFM
jgi:hypothetical protein